MKKAVENYTICGAVFDAPQGMAPSVGKTLKLDIVSPGGTHEHPCYAPRVALGLLRQAKVQEENVAELVGRKVEVVHADCVDGFQASMGGKTPRFTVMQVL